MKILKPYLKKSPSELLLLDNKYRTGIVFSNKLDFEDYAPKNYLCPDSIGWLNKKREAVEYALNYEYDTDVVSKLLPKDNIVKALNEIVYNPVWDSCMRIGNYDKLKQDCCSCPLSVMFDRCHELFGTTNIMGEYYCTSKNKFP